MNLTPTPDAVARAIIRERPAAPPRSPDSRAGRAPGPEPPRPRCHRRHLWFLRPRPD